MKKLIIIAIAAVAVMANSLEIGQKFPYENFENQHGNMLAIDKSTKNVIIAFTKAQGKIVDTHLQKQKDYLQKTNSVYLTDVSNVPSFVMKMFMLPKFKQYDYEMGFVKDEVKAQTLPRKGENLTLIELDNLEITSIKFSKDL
ncbi:MAG: hypothetical protein ACQESH_06875 [Campylobacterota bacterium]